MMIFRSELVRAVEGGDYDPIQKTCNEWAKDGWEVFSVVGSGNSYRLTAKRDLDSKPFQEGLDLE